MDHSEYIYRILDRETGLWLSRYDYRSGADARWQLDYLESQGVDITNLEIVEQEIVWKTYAEVSVPIEEETIR
jgi:hypothetical protein